MTQPGPDALDVLWGASAIAEFIGKSRRATFHLLERGQIPARKCGAQWVASRRRLLEFFSEAEVVE